MTERPAGADPRYPSPLRYPGGKGRIANFLKLVFLDNDLLGAEYVEPYAGGASVALSLLYEDYASHIHINDIDRSVYSFWYAVLHHTDELCARIQNTNPTVAEWRRQRALQEVDDIDIVDLAFSTFMLNRVNRSGILNGGVIGGYHQQGPWKIDARYNTYDLIPRIEKVARFRTRITLTNHDAGDMLTALTDESQDRALVYLDPPYFVKGTDLYENHYNHDDHVAVGELIASLTHPWIVSYDRAPEIEAIYRDHKSISYSLSYSAQNRYQGSEMMFFSPGLVLPDALSPANIPSAVVRAVQRDERPPISAYHSRSRPARSKQ